MKKEIDAFIERKRIEEDSTRKPYEAKTTRKIEFNIDGIKIECSEIDANDLCSRNIHLLVVNGIPVDTSKAGEIAEECIVKYIKNYVYAKFLEQLFYDDGAK